MVSEITTVLDNSPLSTSIPITTYLTLRSFSVTIDYEIVPTIYNETSVPSTIVTDVPYITYILAVCVSLFIGLITVIPNIILIILVIVDCKLRRLSNYYIISLATADCIVGALVMPCMASYTILGYWALGGVICDLWITFDFMCCTASMLSLCMISLDRYWGITQPLKYIGRRSRKRARFFVASIWIISVVCWVPAIIFFRVVAGDVGTDNACVYLTDPIYILISAIFIYYTPMFTMVFLYINVYLAVKRQFRNIETLEDSKDMNRNEKKHQGKVCDHLRNPGGSSELPSNRQHDGHVELLAVHMYHNQGFAGSTQSLNQQVAAEAAASNGDCDHTLKPNGIDVDIMEPSMEPCGTLDTSTTCLTSMDNTLPSLSLRVAKNVESTAEEMKKFRLRKAHVRHAAMNRRTAQTLGIIVILFLICWLPFVILFPINGFCNCIPGKLYDASYWLAYLNSTLNPFLYGFSLDFRKAFKRIFCKRCTSDGQDASSVDGLGKGSIQL